MTGVQHVSVGPDESGIRLDRWFRRHFPALPHGRLSRLLRKGEIRLDGKRAKTSDRLAAGMVVRVPPLGEAAKAQTQARRQPVSDEDAAFMRGLILHEDDHVIALNKPPGLPTQGGPGLTRHVDGLLDALARDGERPRLVHRLDKDTSGVLLLGRTARSTATLAAAFRSREAEKIYWALVRGAPKPGQGRIDLPLNKLPHGAGEKVLVDDAGKPAQTYYAMVDSVADKASWVALMPRTGRTHQLRVHMAAIGHPIVGDGKYGGAEAFLSGGVSRKLHLHARHIALPHPGGGALSVTAPLPAHMTASWAFFGFQEADGDGAFAELEL
ncbi:MAG: RluA family pseudouridine synthase [Sphingomonadales bacterium]|nr:RluA family pseudouridine synthase [Sphingomonadales bacterium]